MQDNHRNCGKGRPETGPDNPDCPCRGTVRQTECAEGGCGFCAAALACERKVMIYSLEDILEVVREHSYGGHPDGFIGDNAEIRLGDDETIEITWVE